MTLSILDGKPLSHLLAMKSWAGAITSVSLFPLL